MRARRHSILPATKMNMIWYNTWIQRYIIGQSSNSDERKSCKTYLLFINAMMSKNIATQVNLNVTNYFTGGWRYATVQIQMHYRHIWKRKRQRYLKLLSERGKKLITKYESNLISTRLNHKTGQFLLRVYQKNSGHFAEQPIT